ncbi:MAG: PAS domain-containing sensor histidine kinase, partial [Oceanicaulis sp.]
MILAVMVFTIVFGAVIFAKLGQERQRAELEAHAGHARTAALFAEDVEGRLNAVRAALTASAAQIAALPAAEAETAGRRALDVLDSLPGVDGAALLLPGGRIVMDSSLSAEA